MDAHAGAGSSPTPPLLELRHVARRYGRRRVLTDVSFALGRGEIVGIVGENGSGKTTLLQILVGLLAPDAGSVALRGSLGYGPQEPLVVEGLTVDENFRYFATAYRLADWTAARDELLDRLRFASHRDRLVGEVSGGTRQKLNLSLALLHRPDLLVLDEPCAGLDWATYLQFWSLAAALRDAGRGLLVVSHLLEERTRFDRIFELVDGAVRCT